jgi:methyl-accepting chemotaxis protein
MARDWTFGRKLAIGFAVTVVLSWLNGWISIESMHRAIQAKDQVIDNDMLILIDAEKLETATEKHSAAVRGFLLTAETRYRDARNQSIQDFDRLVGELRGRLQRDAQTLIPVEQAHAEYVSASAELLQLRSQGISQETLEKTFIEQLRPRRERLKAAAEVFLQGRTEKLQEAKLVATEAAERASSWVLVIAVVTMVMGVLLAVLFTRTLNRQIGRAVGQVQSSAAELQAAANEQATGARQQATAMTEITTTISELLATSRQIAESARRVAAMADQTASSSRAGEGTVAKAQEAINFIQRQVEQIVTHMLDLGKKTQQIGVVLDIVSELAEQTNILAINATIEAIGAGDGGKRFAVVADEIRRLADRVSIATKEIRSLIEDVRSAANTTVMATETGSKTVDAGSRHFNDVTSSLRQISGLVSNTTEAAREIELSTKQQTSAVEQVNLAVANVAQATRETETSSAQTLQTASQLATLSRELLAVVQSDATI